MIRVITKNKEEVKVYNYHKYQVFDSSNTEESFKATYHLYLNKKDAHKFFVNDVVEVAFMGNGWVVRSVSHLDGDTFCVELTQEYESTKKEELETKDETTKLESKTLESKIPESKTSCSGCDYDGYCDCCSCEFGDEDCDTKGAEDKGCKVADTCEGDCSKCNTLPDDDEWDDSKDGMLKCISALVNNLDGGKAKEKLPKHLICIFSDGVKDTVAFEVKDGDVKDLSIAKLHKKDKFDFHTGAKITLKRLTGSGEDKEVVVLPGSEEPVFDPLTGKAIRVGDYVKASYGLNDVYGVVEKEDNNYFIVNHHDFKLLDEGADVVLIWRP